jgi:hypothetical protein
LASTQKKEINVLGHITAALSRRIICDSRTENFQRTVKKEIADENAVFSLVVPGSSPDRRI